MPYPDHNQQTQLAIIHTDLSYSSMALPAHFKDRPLLFCKHGVSFYSARALSSHLSNALQRTCPARKPLARPAQMAAAGTLHSSAAAQATVTLTANEAQLMNLTGAYSTERPPRCRILIPGLAMGDTDGLCIQKGNSISIPADKQALKARVKEQLVAKGVDLTGVDLFSAELGVQKFRSGGGSALSRTITLGLNIPTARGCEFLTAFTQGDGVVMPMISLANHSHVKVEAAKVSVIFQAGAGGRHAGADDRVRAAQYGEQAQLYNHSALAIIRDHTLGGGCEDPTAALQQISATYINEANAAGANDTEHQYTLKEALQAPAAALLDVKIQRVRAPPHDSIAQLQLAPEVLAEARVLHFENVSAREAFQAAGRLLITSGRYCLELISLTAYPDGDKAPPELRNLCSGGILLTDLPELLSRTEMGNIAQQFKAKCGRFRTMGAPLLQASRDQERREAGDTLADPSTEYPIPSTVDLRGQPLSLVSGDVWDIADSLIILDAGGMYNRLRDVCMVQGDGGEPCYRLPTKTLCLPLMGPASFALTMLGVNDGELKNTSNCLLSLNGTRVHLALPAGSPYGTGAQTPLTPMDALSPYRNPMSIVGLAFAAMLGRPSMDMLSAGFLYGTEKRELRQLRDTLIETLMAALKAPHPQPIRSVSPMAAAVVAPSGANLVDLMMLSDDEEDGQAARNLAEAMEGVAGNAVPLKGPTLGHGGTTPNYTKASAPRVMYSPVVKANPSRTV
ncbi:hypothetical protein PLESTF_000973300 [Pleodorina starrii]|nr:hypothetical protein PLESTF_000973300 [Pleodorina starrii]